MLKGALQRGFEVEEGEAEVEAEADGLVVPAHHHSSRVMIHEIGRRYTLHFDTMTLVTMLVRM